MPLKAAAQAQLAMAHSHYRGVHGFLELQAVEGSPFPPPLPCQQAGNCLLRHPLGMGRHLPSAVWRCCWSPPYLGPQGEGGSQRSVMEKSLTNPEEIFLSPVGFWGVPSPLPPFLSSFLWSFGFFSRSSLLSTLEGAGLLGAPPRGLIATFLDRVGG